MNLPRPSRYPGLLLIGLAHCAALYCLLQSQRLARTPRAPRDAIQWLLPMPTAPTPRAAAPRPAAAPVRMKTPPAAPRQTPPVAGPAPAAPAAPPADDSAPAPYDPFDTKAPAPRPSTDAILAQARLDAGKIDKELRKTFPIAEPLPPPDSKQARLQRGFDAAHDAVPPKWYQGAKMVELGTPDGENKSRTYKIITAFVTYCINIRPDGKKSYTNCPS